MNQYIECPLCKQVHAELVDKISVEYLKRGYKRQFNINVDHFFNDLDNIGLYKCAETNYQFYFPFNVKGDSIFYLDLQNIEWYYKKWKWEFDVAYKLIEPKDKILEIGCGKGEFLKKVSEKATQCIGLEINDHSVQYSDKKYTIINSTIESFAKFRSDKFDWVLSFQVLEHISEIRSFIDCSLKTLKQGGKLLIAVPNNDNFFFKERLPEFADTSYQQTLLLNFPPHHMGLWNQKAFSSLEAFFSLKLKRIYYEPLQPWRYDLNCRLLKEIKKVKFPNNKPLVSDIELWFKKIFHKSFKRGDTIIALFEKSSA
ncbi:MAG TPA: class I SAM-dependent methyltransferase [Chitinophagaceae bacterium]|nr:class I SAM-dependent methyltransferase [Chitinophagaceae bacterium]